MENFERYDRQIKLPEIGLQGQKKLTNAKVLIVGIGGLGCPCVQYLVAAGVGQLGLLDGDDVDISNLHRQILFKERHVGQPKALVAKEILEQLNSGVTIRAYSEHLTVHNAIELFEAYDIIVDGTDNFQTKYLINDACVLTGKPFVGASIYKYQGQISVFNYQNGPTYRCLYPNQQLRDDSSCEVTGVLGVLPGIMGTNQATEVIKIILGIGTTLSGKVKIIDTLSSEDQILTFTKKPNEIKKVLDRPLQAEIISCQLRAPNKSYLDVRESYEQPQIEKADILRIPLKELSQRFSEIPKEDTIHVFCQSGVRSKKAVEFLIRAHGFRNLVDAGGIANVIK